jgi:hypothetical protein
MMTVDAVECNHANTDEFSIKQPCVCSSDKPENCLWNERCKLTLRVPVPGITIRIQLWKVDSI